MTAATIIAFTGNLPRTIGRAISQWEKVFKEKYSDFGITKISLSHTGPEELRAELESPPFLIEKRLVIVSVSESNPDLREKMATEDYWSTLFGRIPSETTVVFTGFLPTQMGTQGWKQKYEKSGSGTKSNTNTGKSGGKGKKQGSITQENLETVILGTITSIGKRKVFEIQNEQAALEYIQDELPGISRKSAELLRARIGNNPENIENEVRKFSLLGDTVTDSIIIENTRENSETTAFDTLDALIAGNVQKAYINTEKQFESEDGIQVLRAYIGALRKPAIYCSLLLSGRTMSTAIEISSINEYAAKKYSSIDTKKKYMIVSLYLELIQIDLAGKTGKLIGDANSYENAILSAILACRAS